MKNLFKKAIVIMVVAVIGLFSTVSAVAAPSDDIIAAAKENIPSAYEYLYLASFEAALERIDIQQDQADLIVAELKATKAKVPTDKGHSLHLYSEAERKAMIDCFAYCCEILELTYKVEVKNSDVALHKSDEVVYVYANDGKELVATLDGDVVKKTDAPDLSTQMILLIIAGSALVLSGVTLLVCKKLNKKGN